MKKSNLINLNIKPAFLRGFTLIELLIVISIIGILSSIILIMISSSREKAHIAAYKSQADSLVPAIINRCMTSAVTAADVNALIGLVDGAPKRKIAPLATITATTSCGGSAAGTFTVNINSVDLGTGPAATACETGTTVLTHKGIVYFPPACR